MPLSFSDEPRGDLDKAIDDLVIKARGVLGIQSRLRALLKANSAIIEHLDLPVVLQRITDAAVELVGAQYGALGVVSPEGGLEQFITVGMGPEDIARIGHLPEGHGLLGALIADPHPIRTPTIADHPLSTGFPKGHPPMTSFLGVPIRVRDEVYGNLYLSNQEHGEFTAEDEQLVTALAATAGIAIENARLYSDTQRRQAWTAASAEITAALLAGDEGDTFAKVADRMLRLASADAVWVLLPSADAATHRIAVAAGVDAQLLTGTDHPASPAYSALVEPRLLDERTAGSLPSDGRPLGSVLAVPLPDGGVLIVARLAGGSHFARDDLELAAAFAGQVSVAMELAAARSDRQRIELLEDRGRIARDLHDHVIQQLFATGLELQALASTDETPSRLLQSVAGIDASISHIRTIIYALAAPTSDPHATVRSAVLDLVRESAASLPHTPTVHFAGPLDLLVTDTLVDDVIAVTREALMNVIKHADAQNTSVSLVLEGPVVVLSIEDDGRGMLGSSRRSGVANLERRALLRGGSLVLDSDATGTRLRWSVPLEAEVAPL